MTNAKNLSKLRQLLPEMYELITELSKQPWNTKLEYDCQKSSILVGKRDQGNPQYIIERVERQNFFCLFNGFGKALATDLSPQAALDFLHQDIRKP